MNEILHQIFGEHFSVIALRLVIALILSGIIGFEREMNNQFAGFRTHILVGVGACLMMLLSVFGFIPFMERYDNVRFDPARIPSYVVSGIGFLGAGTIMVYGGTIRGLTTAASIWTVAGIGLVVGSGMYGAAMLATIIILVSLKFLNKIEKLVPKNRSSYFLKLEVKSAFPVHHVIEVVEQSKATIMNIEIHKLKKDIKQIIVHIEKRNGLNQAAIVEKLANFEEVIHISDISK